MAPKTELMGERILRVGIASPVIISVAHDGGIISLKNGELPIRRSDKRNDEGTAYFVLQIFDCLSFFHESFSSPNRTFCSFP